MKIKRITGLICALLFPAIAGIAQDLIQYPAPGLELIMEQSGGKNGAAVTYNPDLYYFLKEVLYNSDIFVS